MAADVIHHAALKDGAQPPTKGAFFGIQPKTLNGLRDRSEDILHDVLRFFRRECRSAAPAANEGGVEEDHPLPRRLVATT